MRDPRGRRCAAGDGAGAGDAVHGGAASLPVAEQTIFGTPQEAERGEGLRRMRGLMTLDPGEYPALARAADDLAEPFDPEAVFDTVSRSSAPGSPSRPNPAAPLWAPRGLGAGQARPEGGARD